MKKLPIYLALLATVAAAPQSPNPARVQQSHFFESPMLVGVVEEIDLRQEPFAEWFDAGYAEYSPAPEAINELRSALAAEGLTIEVFFGTWCDDSTRELPRLVRTLDAAAFGRDQLKMVALSDNPGIFKTSPDSRERDLGIHRTPIIVVLRGDQEVGRIVERPADSLEADLVAILDAAQPPLPYGAESALHARYLSENTDLIRVPTTEFLDELETLGDTDSLWHYAYYDLLFNNRPADAADVLRIFLTLHDDDARGYRLLAQAESDLGNSGAALFAVRRALAINPDSRAARELEKTILESVPE